MGPSPYSKYYSPTVLLLDKLTAIEDKRQCTYLTVNPTSLSKASIGSCSLGLAAVVVHHKYFNLPRTYKSTSLAFTCDIYTGSIIYIYICVCSASNLIYCFSPSPINCNHLLNSMDHHKRRKMQQDKAVDVDSEGLVFLFTVFSAHHDMFGSNSCHQIYMNCCLSNL